jgi:hypothetical protein
MTHLLERYREDLVTAGERRLAETSDAMPPTRRLRSRPIALVAAALALVAVPATAGTIVWDPFDDPGRDAPAPSTTHKPPGSELLNTLSVLRRPQTASDRGADTEAALRHFDDGVAEVRVDSIRLLAPDLGVVAVPVERYGLSGAGARSTSESGAAGTTSEPQHADAVCLYVPARDGTAGGNCHTAEAIQHGFALGSQGQSVYGLVPDGVAMIELISGARRAQLAVHDNFFYEHDGAPTAPRTIQWLDAQGRPIKTIDLTAHSKLRPEESPPADPVCTERDRHCAVLDGHGNLIIGPDTTDEEIKAALDRARRQGRRGRR